MLAPDITLEESTHTYTDRQGIAYTSVSSVLSRYKEPFDRIKIATQSAKKQGCSVEEVLADWDTSAPYGTAVHRQLEGLFRGVDYGQNLITPYLPKLIQWQRSPVRFHPESILCHRGLRIAGTADLLIEKPNGNWSIIDWKTNKVIYKTAYQSKRLKPPLDHLEDCNFIHYSLQLNLYAMMLEYPIDKLSLVHIPKGKTTLEVIECPKLQDEVKIILEHFASVN